MKRLTTVWVLAALASVPLRSSRIRRSRRLRAIRARVLQEARCRSARGEDRAAVDHREPFRRQCRLAARLHRICRLGRAPPGRMAWRGSASSASTRAPGTSRSISPSFRSSRPSRKQACELDRRPDRLQRGCDSERNSVAPPATGALRRTAGGKNVRKDPDRQSRRDCRARDEDGAADGDQDRRGLLRRRSRCRPCRDGRRGGQYRAAAGVVVVSRHRQDRRGLPQDRRGSRPSRLRLPLRTGSLRRSAGIGRHRLYRAERRGDCRHGRQDRIRRSSPPRPA